MIKRDQKVKGAWMLRTLLMLLFVLQPLASLNAANAGNEDSASPETDLWFVVWLHDGRRVVKHLAEKPVVRYADERFTLVAEDFEADYAVADVRKFTIADNPEGDDFGGVDAVETSTPAPMQYSREAVTITGGTPGAVTAVYSAAGILVGQYRADDEGTTVIPLEALPAGVLILNSETITYKIIKK